jgi:hypothetical protein
MKDFLHDKLGFYSPLCSHIAPPQGLTSNTPVHPCPFGVSKTDGKLTRNSEHRRNLLRARGTDNHIPRWKRTAVQCTTLFIPTILIPSSLDPDYSHRQLVGSKHCAYWPADYTIIASG